MSEAKMSIADAMRSVMTQIREQTAENNKKWELYNETTEPTDAAKVERVREGDGNDA